MLYRAGFRIDFQNLWTTQKRRGRIENARIALATGRSITLSPTDVFCPAAARSAL